MKAMKATFATALLLLAAACQNMQMMTHPPDTPAKKMSEPLKFRVLKSGQYGALESEKPGLEQHEHPYVAHDPRSYLELWEDHVGHIPPPAVDFDKESAIFLVMGQVPTGGYNIDVKGLSFDDDGETVVVEAPVVEPSAHSPSAMAISAPYIVIAVNRPNLHAALWRRGSETTRSAQ